MHTSFADGRRWTSTTILIRTIITMSSSVTLKRFVNANTIATPKFVWFITSIVVFYVFCLYIYYCQYMGVLEQVLVSSNCLPSTVLSMCFCFGLNWGFRSCDIEHRVWRLVVKRVDEKKRKKKSNQIKL